MNFGEVLYKAWQIGWKFRGLWLVGILAGCAYQGSNGNGSGASGARYSFEGDELPPQMQEFFNRTFGAVDEWQITLIVSAIILVILVLVLIVLVLGTFGRIGLVRGTVLADGGAEKLSAGQLFGEGRRYFWRVLGLNLLIWVLSFLLVIAVALIAIFTSIFTLGLALILWIPLLCLAVPIAWAISVLIEQMNTALVVDDLGVFEAIERGWDVFQKNIGSMIVMGLVLILGAWLAGLLIAAPFLLLMVPVGVGLFTTGQQSLLSVGLICGLIYLPVLVVLGGILNAYVGSAWTLTYLRLTGKPAASQMMVPAPASAPAPEPEPAPEADTL
jgi:hypothetical protein